MHTAREPTRAQVVLRAQKDSNMNIVQALQDKDNQLRISGSYNRWMCGDGKGGWIVYERRRHARNTTVVCETKSEDKAIEALLDE